MSVQGNPGAGAWPPMGENGPSETPPGENGPSETPRGAQVSAQPEAQPAGDQPQGQPAWGQAQGQPAWVQPEGQPVWGQPEGQPVWGQAQGQPVWGQAQWQQPNPWTSDLWARPDTVGGYVPPPPAPPVGPPTPPAGPPRTPNRTRAILAAVVAGVLLVGGLGLANALQSPPRTEAAPPKPTPSASPTAPSTRPTPTPSPSTPGLPSPGPSTLPSAPPNLLPGSPPSSAPKRPLTPQQSKAAAAVSEGLVDVVTTIGFDGAQGAGTGIVLSPDGVVLTNHHVVAGSTSIRVTAVGNGKTYDATVLGYDASHDVAVIKLAKASGLTVAPLGSSSTVQVDDPVVAVGNAGGAGGAPSAVAGTVRGLDRQITATDEISGSPVQLSGLIQFDAAIEPGDSGGALVDADGKVVGVVTAGSAGMTAGAGGAATEGYAVPIDQARSIAAQIIAGKSSSTVHIGETGFLGVRIAPGATATSPRGVQVAGVVKGSAAEKAGLKSGDVITTVDGKAVTSPDALHAAMSAHRPGDTVRLAWSSPNGAKHTASLRLGSGPVG